MQKKPHVITTISQFTVCRFCFYFFVRNTAIKTGKLVL